MFNLKLIFMRTPILCLLCTFFICILNSCNEDKSFAEPKFKEMAPGCMVPDLLTADPGQTVKITAQMADMNGLKKVKITAPTLSLDEDIKLDGKITYMLNYDYTIPASVEVGSLHIIEIEVEGKTEKVKNQIEFIASDATDYELMYFAHEGESELIWSNSLITTSLPRRAIRSEPYKYNFTLYSDEAGARISLLGQNSLFPDVYGTNPDNNDKIIKGQPYISLPGEGYYSVTVNLLTKDISLEKLTPLVTVEQWYAVGTFAPAAGSIVSANEMKPIYSQNPYLVYSTLNVPSKKEGWYSFTTTGWKKQIKPPKDYTSWENISSTWLVSDGSNTKDLWLSFPAGKYKVTLDYYLMEVMIVKQD